MNENELKVLKKLLDRPGKEWTSKEVAEETDTSKPTAWRILKNYSDLGALSERQVGRSKTFKIEKRGFLEKLVSREDPVTLYLRDVAEEFAEEASDLEEVKKIILYGSVARNSANLESDVDVLVVVSGQVEDELYGIGSEISEREGCSIVLDVLTEEELDKMKRARDPFLKTLREEGKVLYERTP
ncbi:hypothetical protein AKJ57_00130 [candidate division MSBL1 archaeon SCGC-AAA259A05]|uniref:Polymerase beta nucleotidyltransferase domain-containing protein n=1 Tax=candidate division MSBL1 archaeon SCGC-AAA259A05 TaxID=1698259 RepID=A0A133UC57_9EURY|nr:hypothetical protein AKJ57_00130 [candidate division MSBL1 archaeon SCGC-AAA259A05]